MPTSKKINPEDLRLAKEGVRSAQARKELPKWLRMAVDHCMAVIVGSEAVKLYEFVPESYLTADEVSEAIPMGLDEARKSFSAMRICARVDDIKFAIKVDDDTVAYFRRRVGLFDERVVKLRAVAAARRKGTAKLSDGERLAAIEAILRDVFGR